MSTEKVLSLVAQVETLLDAIRAEVASAPTPAPTPAPAPAPTPTPAPAPTPTPAPIVTKPGRVPENPAGAVQGLDYIYTEGDYRKLPDFSKEKVKTAGTTTHPNLGLPRREDGYAYRFTGFVYAPADGEYTFFSSSDDGSRLYIGNQLLVENDAIQAAIEKSGKILLQKGYHAFVEEYFDFNGAQSLLVSWAGPGIAKQPIPASAFFRVPAPTKQPPVVETKPEPKTTADNFKATIR